MPAAGQPFTPPQAKNVIPRCALIPTGSTARPVAGTFTTSGSTDVTTEGTAESVTATLSAAISSVVQVGQWLEFVAPAGTSVLAQVRTLYNAAGTSLELTANETIPTGSTAVFPVVGRIRQSADLAETVATTAFSSFDHSSSDVSIGEGSGTLTVNGGYNYYDAFVATAKYAKDNNQKLYIERELPSPDGSVFTTGPIDWAIAILTGLTSNAQDGSNVGADTTFTISGAVNRIEPQT